MKIMSLFFVFELFASQTFAVDILCENRDFKLIIQIDEASEMRDETPVTYGKGRVALYDPAQERRYVYDQNLVIVDDENGNYTIDAYVKNPKGKRHVAHFFFDHETPEQISGMFKAAQFSRDPSDKDPRDGYRMISTGYKDMISADQFSCKAYY